MNSEAAQVAAALGNAKGYAGQILRLAGPGYGLSASEIASGLGLDETIVQHVLDKHAKATAAKQPASDDSKEPAYKRTTTEVEEKLASSVDGALDVLREVMECADTAGVRLAAAKTVLTFATGGARAGHPKEAAGGVNVERINVLLVQGASAYEEQIKRALGPGPTIESAS